MQSAKAEKPRLLTGDTPTGSLHIGHYVGTLENRLKLQDDYDCYFILANKHSFTTHSEHPERIRENVLAVATDWLAVGIDPRSDHGQRRGVDLDAERIVIPLPRAAPRCHSCAARAVPFSAQPDHARR